jgi:hypothetical protein
VILSPNVPATFDVNGTPIVDGRCHNKIHEFVWLPLLRGLPGRDGRDGLDGRDYEPLPSPGEGLVPKKKNRTWLYVVGGLLLAGGIAALAGGGGGDKSNSGETGGAH